LSSRPQLDVETEKKKKRTAKNIIRSGAREKKRL